jgi:hypothetical protein
MKVLFFYTGHKHSKEMIDQGHLLRKHEFLKKVSSVFYYNNNYNKDHIENIENSLKNMPVKYRSYHTEKNAGYYLGLFEGLEYGYENKIFDEFDYVIHIHPDVYILDESRIKEILEEYLHKKVSFIVFRDNNEGRETYFSDIFVFKPKYIEKGTFSLFNSFKDVKIEVDGKKKPMEAEYIVHKMCTLNKDVLQLERFDDLGRKRRRDILGIVHTHEKIDVG